MLRSSKVKMFAMLMAAIVAVSSLAVFAGSASGVVGTGESAGMAYLVATSQNEVNGLGRATTDPANISSTLLTKIRMYGSLHGITDWVKGWDKATMDAPPVAQYAESEHYIDSAKKALYCTYN